MSYLKPASADLRRTRLIVGGLSIVMTGIVMTGFLLESRSGYMKPDPKLIYFQNWKGDRSRADAIADTRATRAVQDAKMAESRTYIATLSGEKRKKAQEQYDKYVNGGGAQKETPYISAAEPPVL